MPPRVERGGLDKNSGFPFRQPGFTLLDERDVDIGMLDTALSITFGTLAPATAHAISAQANLQDGHDQVTTSSSTSLSLGRNSAKVKNKAHQVKLGDKLETARQTRDKLWNGVVSDARRPRWTQTDPEYDI